MQIRSKVRGDRARWLALARTNAEQGLKIQAASNASVRKQLRIWVKFSSWRRAPERLECFDVSHTSGEATVASCVVFNQAGPLKSDYRRFNLKPDAAATTMALWRKRCAAGTSE